MTNDDMCPNCVTPWKCNGPHAFYEDAAEEITADPEYAALHRAAEVSIGLEVFLLARIAEDEAAPHGIGALPLILDDDGEVVGVQIPPRWRAECEAKRRIVSRHRPFSHGRCQACRVLNRQDDWSASPWPCADLRDFAAIYADHPDYREEWKP